MSPEELATAICEKYGSFNSHGMIVEGIAAERERCEKEVRRTMFEYQDNGRGPDCSRCLKGDTRGHAGAVIPACEFAYKAIERIRNPLIEVKGQKNL